MKTKKTRTRLSLFSILILLGIFLIVVGIIVARKTDNVEDNKVEENIDYEIVISEEYQDKITVEASNIYYNININGETERILLFYIKTEEEMKADVASGIVDNVEYVGEINEKKYYSATGTGVIVDPGIVEQGMNEPNISDQEKELLQKKLDEYKNVLEVYNSRSKIIKSFEEKK